MRVIYTNFVGLLVTTLKFSNFVVTKKKRMASVLSILNDNNESGNDALIKIINTHECTCKHNIIFQAIL